MPNRMSSPPKVTLDSKTGRVVNGTKRPATPGRALPWEGFRRVGLGGLGTGGWAKSSGGRPSSARGASGRSKSAVRRRPRSASSARARTNSRDSEYETAHRRQINAQQQALQHSGRRRAGGVGAGVIDSTHPLYAAVPVEHPLAHSMSYDVVRQNHPDFRKRSDGAVVALAGAVNMQQRSMRRDDLGGAAGAGAGAGAGVDAATSAGEGEAGGPEQFQSIIPTQRSNWLHNATPRTATGLTPAEASYVSEHERVMGRHASTEEATIPHHGGAGAPATASSRRQPRVGSASQSRSRSTSRSRSRSRSRGAVNGSTPARTPVLHPVADRDVSVPLLAHQQHRHRASTPAARISERPPAHDAVLKQQMQEVSALAAAARIGADASASLMRRSNGGHSSGDAALSTASAVVPTEVIISRNHYLVGENVRLRTLLADATESMGGVLQTVMAHKSPARSRRRTR